MNDDGRKYGIDLLRIIASFMIVMFHSLSQGEVLDLCIEGSLNYYVSWFVYAFVIGGVNIFALISGFVSYSNNPKPAKYSRIIELWMVVVFYGLLINALFDVIKPEWVNTLDYIKAITPVIGNSFWYFNAFIGMYVFKPIIDNGIRTTEEKTLKIITVFIIVLFSLIECFTISFNINYGFSITWIVSLYFVGAVIRKCNIGKNANCYVIAVVILLLGIGTFCGRVFIKDYSFMNFYIMKETLYFYNSPTILISSILLLVLFSKMVITPKIGHVIELLGKATFSVYIVNCTGVFWNNIMSGMFSDIVNRSPGFIVFKITSFSCCFVAFVLLFDVLRARLFSMCKIDRLCLFIEKNTIGKLFKKTDVSDV